MYNKEEREKLLSDLYNEFSVANIMNKKFMFAIGLFSKVNNFSIPNIDIQTVDEIDNVRQFLCDAGEDTYFKIGRKKLPLAQDGTLSIGRLLIELGDTGSRDIIVAQSIEQAWGKGENLRHRLIDNLDKSIHTYIRASRTDWGRSYKIDSTNAAFGDDEAFLFEFKNNVADLETYRESLDMFCGYLCKCGIGSVSFEFCRDENGQLKIVDWDCLGESRVVEHMAPLNLQRGSIKASNLVLSVESIDVHPTVQSIIDEILESMPFNLTEIETAYYFYIKFKEALRQLCENRRKKVLRFKQFVADTN